MTWSWKQLCNYYVLRTILHTKFWEFRGGDYNHPRLTSHSVFRKRHITKGSCIFKHHTEGTAKFRISPRFQKAKVLFSFGLTCTIFKKKFFLNENGKTSLKFTFNKLILNTKTRQCNYVLHKVIKAVLKINLLCTTDEIV